jgi:hypothetical protein
LRSDQTRNRHGLQCQKFIICANTLPNVASQVEIPCVRIHAMNFLIIESVAGQEHEELLFSRFSLSNYVGCSLRATNRRRVFVRCGVLRIEITALVCQRMRCSPAAENVLTASPIADPRPWMLQLLLVPPCRRVKELKGAASSWCDWQESNKSRPSSTCCTLPRTFMRAWFRKLVMRLAVDEWPNEHG